MPTRRLARNAKAFPIRAYVNGKVCYQVTDGTNSYPVADWWQAVREATAHNTINQI